MRYIKFNSAFLGAIRREKNVKFQYIKRTLESSRKIVTKKKKR